MYLLYDRFYTNVFDDLSDKRRVSNIETAPIAAMVPPTAYIIKGNFVTKITCFPRLVELSIFVTVSNQISG